MFSGQFLLLRGLSVKSNSNSKYLFAGRQQHLSWEQVGGQKVHIFAVEEMHSPRCQEEERTTMDTLEFKHPGQAVLILCPPNLQIWKCTHILNTGHPAGMFFSNNYNTDFLFFSGGRIVSHQTELEDGNRNNNNSRPRTAPHRWNKLMKMKANLWVQVTNKAKLQRRNL